MTTVISGSFPAVNSDSDATINGLTVGKGGGAAGFATAFGFQALNATNTGSVAGFGYQSLFANTSGEDNTAVGSYRALYSNTTGNNNIAVGRQALQTNTTGSNNVAIGRDSLFANTTASNNTAVGHQAGYTNTTGIQVTYLGRNAGYLTTGSFNTFVGSRAGYNTSTGTANTYVGIDCGFYMTTGSKNTIIGGYTGDQGGLDIRTSNNNIVLSDGDGNVPLVCVGVDNAVWRLNGKAAGNYAGVLQFCVDHSLKSEIYHADNDDRLYVENNVGGGVYLASGGTSWTSASDERLKNITGEIQNGLSKVCTLRAAEYTWKSDESSKPQVGLIAQDVLAVLPEVVQIPKEGSTNRDGSPAMMGISYTETIPLLVAAIKELKATVDAQAARIAALEGAQ
jgi:hypothetical protein